MNKEMDKLISALGAALLVLGLMLSSAAADPRPSGGGDPYDVTDDSYYSSWARDCRNGWRNSDAKNSCTTSGTVRVDFTRKCTVTADCTTEDGGTKNVSHRGKADQLRTLVNCDGDLVRNACPPPPPPPDPPHPRDSVDVTSRLNEYNYKTANFTCLSGSWQTAPFITYRNCWGIDIKHIVNVNIEDLFAGRLCKVSATCRTWLTIAGLGKLTNDLTTSIMVKAADIPNIYECDGGLKVGSCPSGKVSTDRR
ncbi:MAG: hypothetical protein OXE44_14800 [Nitrospinae bacterium]|nr:hypothetical protein [Nitrospinota bacterium]